MIKPNRNSRECLSFQRDEKNTNVPSTSLKHEFIRLRKNICTKKNHLKKERKKLLMGNSQTIMPTDISSSGSTSFLLNSFEPLHFMITRSQTWLFSNFQTIFMYILSCPIPIYIHSSTILRKSELKNLPQMLKTFFSQTLHNMHMHILSSNYRKSRSSGCKIDIQIHSF